MQRILRDFLWLIVIVFTGFECRYVGESKSDLTGKWKSLWNNKSQNIGIDLNLTFAGNNTFHVEAYGVGQSQPKKASGNYRVSRDTLIICDTVGEPIAQCNYIDTGIYTFSKRNDSMFFKVVNDKCESRKMAFLLGLKEFK